MLVQGLEEEERGLELIVHVRLRVLYKCQCICTYTHRHHHGPLDHPPTHLPPARLGLDAAEPVDLALQPPHVLLLLVLLLELPPLKGQLLLLVLVLLLRLLGCVLIIRSMRRKYTTHSTDNQSHTYTNQRTHAPLRPPASAKLLHPTENDEPVP